MVRLETILDKAHRRGEEGRRSCRWQGVGAKVDCGGGRHPQQGVEAVEETFGGENHRGEAGTKVDGGEGGETGEQPGEGSRVLVEL